MKAPRDLSERLPALLLLVVALAMPAPVVAQARPAEKNRPSTPLPVPGAADGGPPTWFAQALAHGSGGVNVTYLWSRGSKFRAETVVAGHKIITIVNGDTYYAYDMTLGNGIAIKRSPAAISADDQKRRPFGNELATLKAQGAEKVGDEVVAGQPCEKYRVTDDAGRRVLWVTANDEKLPVRVEIFDRRFSRTNYTDFINWLSGLTLSDPFFEPDSNIALERMTLKEYVNQTATTGPVGPVPILYADLLHGRRGAGRSR
jgi:outer membrane lipoprotein-sorting protein